MPRQNCKTKLKKCYLSGSFNVDTRITEYTSAVIERLPQKFLNKIPRVFPEFPRKIVPFSQSS